MSGAFDIKTGDGKKTVNIEVKNRGQLIHKMLEQRKNYPKASEVD
jgi:hypothetical protein